MYDATARAASRRGSSITIRPSLSHGSSKSASGTRVLLPAPGGASSTTGRERASSAATSPSTESTGSGGPGTFICRTAGAVTVIRSSTRLNLWTRPRCSRVRRALAAFRVRQPYIREGFNVPLERSGSGHASFRVATRRRDRRDHRAPRAGTGSISRHTRIQRQLLARRARMGRQVQGAAESRANAFGHAAPLRSAPQRRNAVR